MIKNIIYCLIILLPSISCAQDVDEDVVQQKKMRQLMREQIFKLKEGILLVRLQTRENSVQLLKKEGLRKEAEKMDREQKEYNHNIITSFRSNFNFCPVYFFSSNYSENFMSGRYDSIIFLNDSLQPDSSLKPDLHKFLTGEYGNLQQDTATFVNGSYVYHGENGPERRTTYRGGNNTQIKSVRIMSEQLVQLRNPFPYFVRVFDTFPVSKRLSNAVARMNEKLHDFYKAQK